MFPAGCFYPFPSRKHAPPGFTILSRQHSFSPAEFRARPAEKHFQALIVFLVKLSKCIPVQFRCGFLIPRCTSETVYLGTYEEGFRQVADTTFLKKGRFRGEVCSRTRLHLSRLRSAVTWDTSSRVAILQTPTAATNNLW